MMIYKSKEVADKKADAFLFLVICVFGLNIISQIAAFPLQILLMAWGLWQCNVKYIPGLMILLLDKHNITIFTKLTYIKLPFLGFGWSILTTYWVILFVFVLIWWASGFYNHKASFWLFLWLITIVPAAVIALNGRRESVIFWQDPFGTFLQPSLFFWGVAAGPSWDRGKYYLCTRLVSIFLWINVLMLFKVLSIFTFCEHIMSICLFLLNFKIHTGAMWRATAWIGAISGLAAVLFSRYLSMVEETGFATSAEVGSTFTRIMVVVIGVLFATSFGKVFSGKKIKIVPYIGLAFCAIIFFYAVGRARIRVGDFDNVYETWIQRFEYKLIADRGAIWGQYLDEVFDSPLVFKHMENRLVEGVYDKEEKKFVVGLRCMAHNQALKLLCDEGWWLGGILVLFLWWTHLAAFDAASYRTRDPFVMIALMAPYAAVYIAVGLTGQSTLNASLLGNGLLTMAFPGIIYGSVFAGGLNPKLGMRHHAYTLA